MERRRNVKSSKSLLLALAIAAATPAVAADTIKVGLSGPFTGGSSSMGVSMRDGVKLAVSELNKAGGVLGKQLELVQRDDHADNTLSVPIAQDRVIHEQVVATVGVSNTR